MTHRISTPSRLHFTLIDMNGEIGRIDGSLGLSLEHPGVTLEFGAHKRTMVRGGTPSERELIATEIVVASEILDVAPGIEISIRQMIPPHQGLGSGTQIRLAVLSALNHRFELNHSPSEIGEMSTRGGTSGIGINAFRCGGLLLDGGHSVSEQKNAFAPSRFATEVGQPPLLMRSDFPTTWGITLFIPSTHHGLSGQDELDFMLANTPLPLTEVQSASHIILMRLLPALREGDLETFGSCVSALQDVGWKRRHWLRADNEPLQSVRRAFESTAELQGCGLSSTGATIFGFYDATKVTANYMAKNLQNELLERDAIPGQVVCTRANNCGMRMESLT
ncbi:MAG: hypothetical protein OXG05_11640 [Gammaproteobacteria bacterium]|nr:hypothetical protein [Gammaproteobacteria bacterium]